MNIVDEPYADRYFTVQDDRRVINGWKKGWDRFNANGTPTPNLDLMAAPSQPSPLRDFGPLNLEGLWSDTEHYDQNNPGIVAKAKDIDGRLYKSWLEKAFWLNVTRVPLCISYLAGCAKVRPRTILELGTGGDSAHSTGIFLYFLDGVEGGRLASVDRHPLSQVWPRYRSNHNWAFIQGDSINVLHALIERKLPIGPRFDMIFIDSSHNYEPTLAELRQCSLMTDAMLLDDSTHPGVKQAIDHWHPANPDWIRVDLHGAVCLLERHPKI